LAIGAAAAAGFVLHHARIGKGAMDKFETSCLLGDELFYIRMMFLKIGRGAMNAKYHRITPLSW
jgi:hypothetical protein